MPSVIRGSDGFDSANGLSPLAEHEVTGAAETNIVFSGLDISQFRGFRILITHLNPTASVSSLFLYINGDVTPSNYYYQVLVGSGASALSGRGNSASIGSTLASNRGLVSGEVVQDIDGHVYGTFTGLRGKGSAMEAEFRGWGKTAADSNVTELELVNSVTGGFGVGTKVVVLPL